MKLNTEVYIKAAELIARKQADFACRALQYLVGAREAQPYINLAAEYFKPLGKYIGHSWFEDYVRGRYSFDKNRDNRVQMLLFMAEVLKDENNKKTEVVKEEQENTSAYMENFLDDDDCFFEE